MKHDFKLQGVLIIFIVATLINKETNSFTKNFVFKNSIKTPSANLALVDKQLNSLADSIPPDQTGMRNLTSVELAKEMVIGWNVGNSLEAIGGETAWGNPKITQTLIDSIKAAGFNAIRIPVAWSRFTNDSLFTIDTTWLNRVEEVVNYVLKDSMYAIINEHWDGGWQQPTYSQQEYVNNRLAAMWQQIAIHFRDYNDYLLFAGTNEVMVTNNYGTPTVEYYTVQNSFNQTFVTTVRSTGGRNAYRHLVVQGFNTNIDHTVNFFVIPEDFVEDRLMVEVHYYDPYNFTLNENSYVIQWGEDAPNSETWANETWADGQFLKMKTNFIDKGYAVILGEYGVISRLNLGSPELNDEHAEYRRYYIEYITGSIYRHGLVPFYWDNGYTGNYGLGIFNRSTGGKVYPDIVKALIDAVDTTAVGININNLNPKPKEFFLEQNYPNPFNPETTISYSLPYESSVTLKVYDVLGSEIEILLENEKKPAGSYNVSFNAVTLPSSIYFYTLQTDEFIKTMKMTLIK